MHPAKLKMQQFQNLTLSKFVEVTIPLRNDEQIYGPKHLTGDNEESEIV